VGLRKQQISIGSALAFLLGNPVLNPATLIFMGFVLGWQFTAIRAIAGIVLIAIAVVLASRMAPNAPALTTNTDFELAPIEQPGRNVPSLVLAWLKELWNEIVAIIPGYVLIVFILGATRAWLFPAAVASATHGITGLTLLSLAGTAFVIPTAGEIPIVQTLMANGLSISGALALLITLPAISLPTLYIVRSAFPAKVLAATFGVICVGGIVTGAIASLFLH
jgi:uncharacterized protein